MPRDSSGSYTLPLAPVVAGTPIEASWANTTTNDQATALTDSLSRSGLGGMQAPLGLVDGTVLNPAATFNSEANSGLYRAAAFDVRYAIAGEDLLRLYQDGSGNRFFQQWNGTEFKNVLLEGQGVNAAGVITSTTTFEGFGISSVAPALSNEVRITWDDAATADDKQVILLTPSLKTSGQSASVVVRTTTTCNVFTTNNLNDNLVFPIYVSRILLP